LNLLHQTIKSFLAANTYPLYDLLIVNDSGDKEIHNHIKKTYMGASFVFHDQNVGLMKSIDLGYKHINTEYFYHGEDDWAFNGKGGFIEPALAIMEARLDIEEVWFADYNNHPLDGTVYVTPGPLVTGYKLASENYQKGLNEINNNAWHGFTTACALKRLSDYKMVGPYADIPWEGTIWHQEQAIGEKYHELGYRTACLLDDYVYNIGYGQSEYVTGNEL
jgi:hypothetical protein